MVRALPHQCEADLKGGRIVLEGDDEVEDERRDEVGQRDDDGGQILHHQLQQEGTLSILNTQTSVETRSGIKRHTPDARAHLRLLALREDRGDVDAVEASHQDGHDHKVESGPERVDAAPLATRAVRHLTLDPLLLQIRLSAEKSYVHVRH